MSGFTSRVTGMHPRPVLLGLGLSTLVLVLAWTADAILGGPIQQARATFSNQAMILVEAGIRLVIVTLLAAVGYVVQGGPRRRLAGMAMVAAGGYFAAATAFSMAMSSESPWLLPLTIEIYRHPSGFLLWAAAGVAVLGSWELIRPSG